MLSQGIGNCKLRIERSVVPTGCCLCGSKTVRGIATPNFAPKAKLKNLSSALHDDLVWRGLGHADLAHLRQFSLNARLVHVVDLVHQGWREGGLHTKNDANFLHDFFSPEAE